MESKVSAPPPPHVADAMNNLLYTPTSNIVVHLRSVGDAQALKKSKFKINGENYVTEVDKFLRKQLNHEGSLFLYCGSGFCPSPDQKLQDLYDVSIYLL